MRIMIKGGVWKNTEDEILKAAVMKYGKNQWARVSSLLVRKSAKQCKARWYEWLDPSIKKTEWTREEDEKLLHLAKLMPTQWRTIAPIVGRTPAQCLERYEKLLDAACSKDDNYDPTDDPRRLRPGEIDPNPESKPARPDPVDMDEDEKEMLSEARARLANTRGKKAKRKAREKALEEARRLAQLQKTRELKAAGIELKGKFKKKKGIDYNAEVAFEKKAPHGFYDTSGEHMMSKEMGKEFRPVTLEELEGKRRKDIEENLQKQDIKRQKMQARNDAPSAVAKNLSMNEVNPLQGRRGKMMLPAPQISEAELEAIAKMGADSDMDPEMLQGAGGDATKTLLGNYSQTPLPSATPMRTPRTPAMGYDPIMQAAENLAKMSTLQTPLEGGENPELHPSDFSGVTPRAQVMATPNPIATPLRTPGGGPGPGATPSVRATPSQKARSLAGIAATPGSVMATPGRGMSGATPQHRDELGLNDPEATPATRSAQRAAAAMHRNELLAGLSQLPAPQNEYQIMVPELPQEGPADDLAEEDAQDRQKRLEREEAERRERELRKRSQVLQRDMPRPAALDGFMAGKQSADSAVSTNPVIASAHKMVEEEMLALLKHDNAKYPLKDGKEDKKKKKDKKRKNELAEPVVEIDEFEESELQSARSLVSSEVGFLRNAMGHTLNAHDFDEIWTATASDFMHLPSAGVYVRTSSATSSDRVASLHVRQQAES
mmetsp:Transcript_24535/g.68288  ORF Transcript_24535/g.68288 Transcript_24535/m.68288 type:complete len:718 (+) Transcript_24535:87-2240(+)